MYKCIMVLLLLPLTIRAQVLQPVQPIISGDYLQSIKTSLVQRDSLPADSTNSFSASEIRLAKDFYASPPIKKIVIINKKMMIKNSLRTRLSIGGNYMATVELKHVNRLPALQNDYVQGRPLNGAAAWQGPETNELFSYGPAIRLLEFDGSTYPYDPNGKLVTVSTGNGKQPAAHNNSIFRTARLLSQSFNLMGNLYVNGMPRFNVTMRMAQNNEQTFIKANQNSTSNFNTSMGGLIAKKITLTGSYRYRREQFSNSNRNGFLNRLYQSALLTPISFNNAAGTILGTGQRSYSNLADNPEFLLTDNGNALLQIQENAAFSAEGRFRNFTVSVSPTYERSQQLSTEKYKAGTVFFPAGIATDRRSTNDYFQLKANMRYYIHVGSSFNSTVTANYIFGNSTSSILYSNPAETYRYHRNANDYFVGLLNNISFNGFDAGLDLTNKGYSSGTTYKKQFFLPTIGTYIKFNDLPGNVSLKLAGTFNRFNSELPINQSYGYTDLLRLNTAQWQQYFPRTEIKDYNNLLLREHSEWSAKLEVGNWYFNIVANYFVRETHNDIFPVFTNNQLALKNLADQRNRGLEIELTQRSRFGYSNKWSLTNNLSFTSYSSKVTHVADGYNYAPVGGFSNVQKAIVQGQALGSIVGNSWLRDGKGNRVIGADGFPLVNNQPKIIGNPIPDFVMKLSNNLTWKNFSLSLDWEWRKGGDVWNGTRAALDYYGRSKQSAEARNTSNYVFDGVLQDGHVNTIPVSFYDATKPLETNRWVRYGLTGVAEDYIEKGDQLRLNNAAVSYKIPFKKYIQGITVAGYVANVLLWSPYKGADANQILLDQSATTGLDFFNLPSVTTTGFSINIQF